MFSKCTQAMLTSLKYHSSAPVAPSAFLLSFLRFPTINEVSVSSTSAAELSEKRMLHIQGALKLMMSIRGILALGVAAAWLARHMSRSHDAFDIVMFPELGSSEVSDSFSLSIFFYLMLMILQGYHQSCDKKYLPSLGSPTHMTIWCLHAFTATIIFASTFSYTIVMPYYFGQFLTSRFHMPLPSSPNETHTGTAPFWNTHSDARMGASASTSVELAMGVFAMVVEILASSWKVHWMLLVWGAVWFCSLAGVLVLINFISTQLFDVGVLILPPTSLAPTLIGEQLVLISFAFVWILQKLRDSFLAWLAGNVAGAYEEVIEQCGGGDPCDETFEYVEPKDEECAVISNKDADSWIKTALLTKEESL